jgi:hypothetical protein
MRIGKTAFKLLSLGLFYTPWVASESLFPPERRISAFIVISILIWLLVMTVDRLHKRKGKFAGWVEGRLPKLTLARGALFTGVSALWMASLYALLYLPAAGWQKFMTAALIFICWVLSISLLESKWLRSDLPLQAHA